MPAERRASPGLSVALVAAGFLGAGVLAWKLLARAPDDMPDLGHAPGSASAVTTTAPTSSSDPQLDDETAHYRQLRTTRDPARSLALADEGQERFVQGKLYPDREVIAIRALLRLQRRDEAEQRAERFFRRYPNTTQADLVRRMLAPRGR